MDENGYSQDWIPVDTPITITGLPEGKHIVSVIARKASNAEQEEANATIARWTVDTIAPTVTISGTPNDPTNQTTATLTVGGMGVIAYMYDLDGGGYSTETTVTTPIVLLNGLGHGPHTVSVIGKDTAENWQAEAEARTTTWTAQRLPLMLPQALTMWSR